MKPSERIKEIHATKILNFYHTETSAILAYLDEEFEKKQENELEDKVCPKCGFSGQIDKNNICWSSECNGK